MTMIYHIGCSKYCPNGIDPTDTDSLTRKVRLRFLRSELLYDISNYAYIEGHVMGEDKQEAQHTLVDIAEDGNIDRVDRILSVVHAAAVEMLYPYTKTQLPEDEIEEVDDIQQSPEEYIINMSVPTEFSATTVQLLSKLVHEFMVYRVLYDWLNITNPEKAQYWLLRAQEAEEQVNSIKNMRTGVLTRKPSPF